MKVETRSVMGREKGGQAYKLGNKFSFRNKYLRSEEPEQRATPPKLTAVPRGQRALDRMPSKK